MELVPGPGNGRSAMVTARHTQKNIQHQSKFDAEHSGFFTDIYVVQGFESGIRIAKMVNNLIIFSVN